VPLAIDSRDMSDIVAYMRFLSRAESRPARTRRGSATVGSSPGRRMRELARRCLPRNAHVVTARRVRAPALRHPCGAGVVCHWSRMARINAAAAYIRWNMPNDRPGSVGDQQAYDVAAFLLSHPRPDTPGKERDWPNGDAPEDAAYTTLAGRHTGPARH